MTTDALHLHDDAHVAIIGGGPAGALFAHFVLKSARAIGLRLNVSIYDGKGFTRRGAPGCNMSAGVVAHDFAEEVRAAGIGLPPNVIQRRINGYWIETVGGTVRLEPPHESEEVLTVYRGNGPRGATYHDNISFDDHLLDFVRREGARVVPQHVYGIKLPRSPREPAVVCCGRGEQSQQEAADLVVGAFGINSRLTEHVASLGFGYRPPAKVDSIQAEIELGHDVVDGRFGDAIGVYVLNLPRIRFAAITPKYDYVTVTVVGDGVGDEDLAALLGHPAVRRRLQTDSPMSHIACRCRPHAVAGSASHPYADRLVLIGDSAASRLYKNGLQSSLVTARAAAEVAVRYGVSSAAFARHYDRVCRQIAWDNGYGRFLFHLYDYALARRPGVARRLINAVQREQETCPTGQRPACEILWDTLSGTRRYATISARLLRPTLYSHLWREGATSK